MNEFDRKINDSAVLTLVTPPAVEPIGLDEVKAQSRIGITEDDLLIQDRIIAARLMVERQYNLALITQTWTLSLCGFPTAIQIFKHRVQSITKIEYLVNGVLTTLSAGVYKTDLNYRPPRIVLMPSYNWPSLADDRPGSVVVTFKAGYGDTPDSVPMDLRVGLVAIVASLYENREAHTGVDVPVALSFYDALFANERLYAF